MLKIAHIAKPTDQRIREIAMRWVRNDQKKVDNRIKKLYEKNNPSPSDFNNPVILHEGIKPGKAMR